jgi:hypothetical protein
MDPLWVPIRIGMWTLEFNFIGLDLAQLFQEPHVRVCKVLAAPKRQSNLLEPRLLREDFQTFNQMLVVHISSLLVALAVRGGARHGVVEADPHVTDVGRIDGPDEVEEESQVLVSNLFPLTGPEWSSHVLVALEAECVLTVQNRAALFIDLTTGAKECRSTFEVVGLGEVELPVILEKEAVDLVAEF